MVSKKEKTQDQLATKHLLHHSTKEIEIRARSARNEQIKTLAKNENKQFIEKKKTATEITSACKINAMYKCKFTVIAKCSTKYFFTIYSAV